MLKVQICFRAAMPDSYWKGPIAFIALGVFFCALTGWISWNLSADFAEARVSRESSAYQHTEYAKDRIRQICSGRDPATFLECVTEEVISSKDYGRAENDLDAQQSMAFWAMFMAYIGIAGLAATGIGAFLVWKSLLVTKDAVGITRDIGKIQTMAYVDAAKAHFFWGDKYQSRPKVELWIRAFGETPAKWYEARMHHFVIPRGDGPLNIPWNELSDTHIIGKWSVLVEGDNRRVTADLHKHKEEIKKTIHYIFGGDAFEFYVFGDIKYCTFYDEVFTTQFCFGRRDMPDYGATRTELTSENGARISIRENPIHLTRPTCDLDAYKKTEV